MRRMHVGLVFLALLFLSVARCKIELGNPTPKSVTLGVPYRSQEVFNFCTAAAVLMWRLYDHLPEISQDEIIAFEGGFPVQQPAVANAVNQFTLTHDAEWDAVPSSIYDQLTAREIASFNAGRPSIAIINASHVGVVDGGTWHTDDQGFNVWDGVYLNDPATIPDDFHNANEWLNLLCLSGQCDQIVSAGAAESWDSGLSQFGPSVRISGRLSPSEQQQ